MAKHAKEKPTGRSNDKAAKPSKTAKNTRHPLWYRILCWLTLGIDVLAVAALLLSGYAGCFSPLKHGGVWGVIGLTFTPVIVAVLILAFIQLFWCRRGLWILAVGILLCAGPLLTVCPLNVHLGKRTPAPGDSTFTILAYNVANLEDQREPGTFDNSYNATLSYILSRDADIVCLSEGEYLFVNAQRSITPEQFDSISRRYPHIIFSSRSQTTLSKYPIEPIHIAPEDFGNGHLAIYRVTLPGEKLMTLISVHLQSFSLTEHDKELYREVTDLHRENLGNVREQLLHKISFASVCRAQQAQYILGLIRHYGGQNVIICGDFNDVPDCYTIRAFEGAGFKSVYPQIGFGPIITFNADRFYFCIDHILYRGDFKPLRFYKGSNRSSDHYPIEAEFEIL